MKIEIQIYILIILAVGSVCLANSAPTVKEVYAKQRDDSSGIVDIYYTLSDADGDKCSISVVVSSNGGSSWNIIPSASALKGQFTNVSKGRWHITWNSKLDLPGVFGANYRVKVTADDIFLNDGLVAYYKLDGTSGAVVDEMGKYNGTAYGNLTRGETGKVGNAFKFDGGNDYVMSSSNINITGKSPRTINFWVYCGNGDNAFLVAYGTNPVGTGFGAFVRSDTVRLWGGCDDVDTGYVLPINEWHMLTLKYDGAVRSLWVDGQNIYNQTHSLNTVSNKLYLSNNPGQPNPDKWGLLGKIDEVRIYNRALNNAEISQLYNDTAN